MTENCIKICTYDSHLKKKKHEKSIDLRVVRLPWLNENIFSDPDFREKLGNQNKKDFDLNKVKNNEG